MNTYEPKPLNSELPVSVPRRLFRGGSASRRPAWSLALGLTLLMAPSALAQLRLFPKPKEAESTTASGNPTAASIGVGSSFAPMAPDHPLAAVWNDAEFSRRLYGSYGFLSEAEPRMTPEEQLLYREQVVPLLTGDPKTAIPKLKAIVPAGASAVFDFTLATLHFQAEDFDRAIEGYELALSKFPDYRRAQRNLALVWIRTGKYREAIPPLLRTIALGGGDGRVYGLLGFAYMNQERPLAAEGAYKQALVFEPDNLDFRLGLVKCYLATAQYDPALALLDELLVEHPDREVLWTLQANVFIQKERPGEAAVTLEMLRRLGGATPNTLFLLGDLHLSNDNAVLALDAYQQALQSGEIDSSQRALRPLELLVNRGAWDAARDLIGHIRAASTDPLPDDVENRLLRQEVKMALASGADTDAIPILNQLLERNPLDGEALLLAGDYFGRTGDTERAVLRYEAAARIDGFEADAWVRHAQLLVQSRKYVQATELLRKAQKLQPRDSIQRYLERVEQAARSAGRS